MKSQSLSIAEVIREERKKAGLSQAELGKRLGVSQSMIAQYECGIRTPKIPTIRRIADALEADLEPFYYAYHNVLEHNFCGIGGADVCQTRSNYCPNCGARMDGENEMD